ncbi:MAG: hypothetical protein ACI4K6_03200 [Candidatus Fimenecus sp.]
MGKVYYVGHYADEQNTDMYKFAVPAKAKMDYIIQAMHEVGFSVTVWSLSDSRHKRICLPKRVVTADGTQIAYIFAVRVSGKITSLLSRVLKNLQLLWYILRYVQAEDTVMVYHSLAFMKGVSVARRLKKFRLVMDIEELYAHSWGWSAEKRAQEEHFLEQADGYLLVNDTIANTVQIGGKPSAVVYGAYTVPQKRDVHFDDDRIHIVYAGTIEETKCGAFTALETSAFLTPHYKMHILGFGRPQTIEKLKTRVSEINTQLGYTAVSYDGFLQGQAFSDFLMKCRIGISSYIMEADFANNVFPSKLLTYVAHDLTVVTGYSEAFARAAVSENWVYYYEYKPQAIAQAVLQVDLSKKEQNRDLVCRLHQKFVEELPFVLRGTA